MTPACRFQLGLLPRQIKGLKAAALGLFLLLSGFARAQFCTDCIDIRTGQQIYRPGDQVQISLDVDSAAVPASHVDAYVAAILPDNRVVFIRQMKDWQVQDLDAAQIAIESLKNQVIGQYQLYFVLARPGQDPLDSNGWIAVKTVDLALLPEQWQSGDDPGVYSNSSGLPSLITHGGGEIEGQIVTNSREALDRAYELGQRFFELDFSWTADDALVLIHDWDRTYRRLFSRAASVPTLVEFEAMEMNYGLTRMSLDDLLNWLRTREDARIITDIKQENLVGLQEIAAQAGNLAQFVPQIYSTGEYDAVAAMGYRNIIFTLYRTDISNARLLEFVKSNPVRAVTLPAGRAIADTTAQELSDAGVAVYAHTVNFPELHEYLRSRGVYGIYSDKLLPVAQ